MNWMIGWAASAIAATIAMPFDTVKRVMMKASVDKRYKNMIECWSDWVEHDGITRLWRGTHNHYYKSVKTNFKVLFQTLSAQWPLDFQ